MQGLATSDCLAVFVQPASFAVL